MLCYFRLARMKRPSFKVCKSCIFSNKIFVNSIICNFGLLHYSGTSTSNTSRSREWVMLTRILASCLTLVKSNSWTLERYWYDWPPHPHWEIHPFWSPLIYRPLVVWLCQQPSPVRLLQSSKSEYKVLSRALPQGTKLGPIGFQVVINDAAQDLGDKIKCRKYVDDLTLAENRSFPQPSGMQVVLDEFNEWTNNNKLSLNPSKCQAFQVCFKTNTPPHAELSFAWVPLSFVPEAKILGVWLQNDLQWDKSINEISKKANHKLYILQLLKRFWFIDDELLSVYKCYVRPVVEYADVTWSCSITAAQRKILEHLQKRACRSILGQRYTTYADALETCWLESLAHRRESHCRGFAEGLANSERTNDILPPTRLESHACNLRNASNYSQLRIRTSRFKQSPIPCFINLLNQPKQTLSQWAAFVSNLTFGSQIDDVNKNIEMLKYR